MVQLNLSGIKDVMSGGSKNIALFIVVIGFIQYWLRIQGSYTQQNPFSLTMSLLLFVLAGYALANRMETDRSAVFLPMLIFCIWYFLFGASYDPRFLLYFGVATLAILVIPMIFTKGESVMPELIGLLPVLFLFLDIGLLPFLLKKLSWPLTDLMKNLIFFMPWWAFFGIFTLPTQATDNNFVNFLVGLIKVAGIFYIMFIFVAPAVPTLGYDKSLLPSVKELEKTQAEYLKKFPKTENPAWSNLVCTFQAAINPTESLDVDKCIKDRQQASRIEYVCKTTKKLLSNTKTYENCVAQEKEKRKKAIRISGTSDPTIKQPTKIDLEIQTKEKSLFIRKADTKRLRFPAELKIKNPLKRKLAARVKCSFKKGDKITKGMVEISSAGPKKEGVFKNLGNEEIEKNVICTPPSTITSGSYTLTYQVKVENLESKSRLTRAFIGDKNGTERKKLISKLKSTFRDLTKGSRSAKNPARINFALGEPPSDPIIEKDDNLLLRVDVQKNTFGDILKIKNYQVDLKPISTNQNCLSGKENALSKLLPKPGKRSISSIPLASCFIKQGALPATLNNPKDFVIKEFEASIVYDYQIEKKTNIKIEFLEDIK